MRPVCLFFHAGSHLGTSKTAYLYLCLVQCMITGTLCLFQTRDCIIYLIAESLTRVNDWTGRFIAAFCDVDLITTQPPNFIICNWNMQTITMSLLTGTYEKWAELVCNRKCSGWSWKEYCLVIRWYKVTVGLIRQCRNFQHLWTPNQGVGNKDWLQFM